MVRIRMKKTGRRNRPCFRIVVADQQKSRDGKVIETIGQYDPMKKDQNLTIKQDRYEHWVKSGAQPSEALLSLLKRATKGA